MQTIRALREARGLTQHQLAALVGTSSAVVSHWETGNRGISAVMLRMVARALGVSMDEIALPGDRENDRSS